MKKFRFLFKKQLKYLSQKNIRIDNKVINVQQNLEDLNQTQNSIFNFQKNQSDLMDNFIQKQPRAQIQELKIEQIKENIFQNIQNNEFEENDYFQQIINSSLLPNINNQMFIECFSTIVDKFLDSFSQINNKNKYYLLHGLIKSQININHQYKLLKLINLIDLQKLDKIQILKFSELFNDCLFEFVQNINESNVDLILFFYEINLKNQKKAKIQQNHKLLIIELILLNYFGKEIIHPSNPFLIKKWNKFQKIIKDIQNMSNEFTYQLFNFLDSLTYNYQEDIIVLKNNFFEKQISKEILLKFFENKNDFIETQTEFQQLLDQYLSPQLFGFKYNIIMEQDFYDKVKQNDQIVKENFYILSIFADKFKDLEFFIQNQKLLVNKEQQNSKENFHFFNCLLKYVKYQDLSILLTKFKQNYELIQERDQVLLNNVITFLKNPQQGEDIILNNFIYKDIKRSFENQVLSSFNINYDLEGKDIPKYVQLAVRDLNKKEIIKFGFQCKFDKKLWKKEFIKFNNLQKPYYLSLFDQSTDYYNSLVWFGRQTSIKNRKKSVKSPQMYLTQEDKEKINQITYKNLAKSHENNELKADQIDRIKEQSQVEYLKKLQVTIEELDIQSDLQQDYQTFYESLKTIKPGDKIKYEHLIHCVKFNMFNTFKREKERSIIFYPDRYYQYNYLDNQLKNLAYYMIEHKSVKGQLFMMKLQKFYNKPIVNKKLGKILQKNEKKIYEGEICEQKKETNSYEIVKHNFFNTLKNYTKNDFLIQSFLHKHQDLVQKDQLKIFLHKEQ